MIKRKHLNILVTIASVLNLILVILVSVLMSKGAFACGPVSGCQCPTKGFSTLLAFASPYRNDKVADQMIDDDLRKARDTLKNHTSKNSLND